MSNVGFWRRCIVATSAPAIVSIDNACFHGNSVVATNVAETAMVVIGTIHVVCSTVVVAVIRIAIVCAATIVVAAVDSTEFMTCVCCAT